MAAMKRLAYAEVNYGNPAMSATSEAAANEAITLPVMQFDGATQILLEFNMLAFGASTGFDCILVLFDGDTPLGEIFRARSWASSGGSTGNMFSRVLTPTAGLHRYNVRGWGVSGANFVLSADKAGENGSPMFLRAYALEGPGTAAGNASGTKVEVGMFQPSNAVQSKTITLADEDFGQVALLMLLTVYNVTPTDTDGNAIMSVGIGTDRGGTVSQYYATMWDQDASSTIQTAVGGGTGSILKTLNSAAAAVDFEIDLLSLGDAQFEIDLVDVPTTAGVRVYYMAIGGSHVTDALVGNFNSTAATGTQDITVVSGFGKPDLIIPVVGHPPGTDAGANIRFQFGAGKSDTEMGVTGFNIDDGTADVEMSAYQDAVFMAVINNDTAMGQVATLSAKSAWPTDGFQINKSVAGLALAVMAYAALRGSFTSVIGFNTAPTAAAPQTQILPIDATPKGAIFFHNALIAISGQNNSNADLGTIGIGITDGIRQYWVGTGDDDAAAAAVSHRNSSESKAVKMFTPSASGTLTSEASAAFVGESVVLTWADTDTAAREYRYLLLGDAPVPRYGFVNHQNPGVF